MLLVHTRSHYNPYIIMKTYDFVNYLIIEIDEAPKDCVVALSVNRTILNMIRIVSNRALSNHFNSDSE